MVDPIVTGALWWVLERLAGRGLDRLLDNIFDRPRAGLPARRHDLSVPGGQYTSDVDITVLHHQAQARVPAILTFQKFNDTTTGITLPMVLGDTAHVTLPRNHYFITALIIDVPKVRGDLPTLRGLGWSQPYVADNHTARISIATQRPTDALITKIGLRRDDGSVPFILPAAPAWTAGNDLKARFPLIQPKADIPSNDKLNKFFRQPPASPFGALLGQQPAKPAREMCRASAWVGTGACAFLAHQDSLCKIHRDQILNGAEVFDHATGKRIVL